ncbi:TraE/TraK family type IV conjugative transfer system protein [Kosakonia sacchari]|uniref:TraE/TraK family type IV conjugative transfer system protein n=1 Tax=Kosakonia sacchari TaxID=1158459 RepID=A0ABZ0MZ31_9ENTR|nr:TraE/TraK family type IV conjugative transfer system protein [Kosakonia sacchari]WOZ79934.1 TraE/TraK family type IV conjugative transfer system protein [Kosakonia sacchari]
MKLKIKGERDKYTRLTIIALAAFCVLTTAGTVISSSLAWYFARTQKTVTTPMTYNQPFTFDATSADTQGMTMFATSFLYLRLNVTPENVDVQHKLFLSHVPSVKRDKMKKVLDVEADRIKKGGITWRYDLSELRMIKPGVVDADVVLHPSTTNGNITTDLKEQKKTYQLSMDYENGIISLNDMSELVPATTN